MKKLIDVMRKNYLFVTMTVVFMLGVGITHAADRAYEAYKYEVLYQTISEDVKYLMYGACGFGYSMGQLDAEYDSTWFYDSHKLQSYEIGAANHKYSDMTLDILDDIWVEQD